MNPLDIFMVIVWAYFLAMGLLRGILREAAAIVGVFAGFYAGFGYYAKLSEYLTKWLSDPGYINILSFLIIFCCVYVLLSALGIVVRYLLKIVPFGWLDRALGGTLGMIKGILMVSALLLALTAFLKNNTPLIRNSRLAPHVSLISEQMAEFVSKDTKRRYETKVRILKKSWKAKS